MLALRVPVELVELLTPDAWAAGRDASRITAGPTTVFDGVKGTPVRVKGSGRAAARAAAERVR